MTCPHETTEPVACGYVGVNDDGDVLQCHFGAGHPVGTGHFDYVAGRWFYPEEDA